MEKEQWKQEVLRSLEGAKRAEPNPLLYAGIRERIAHTAHVVRPAYLTLAAACLALLLVANILALRHSNAEKQGPSVYRVENANFDLY
jgi:hypothetical protein